jgi:predicted dienelactone hydrolase
MYVLEILLTISLLLLVIVQHVRAVDRRVLSTLFTAALVAFLASLILGQLRWQMAPIYLLLLVLTLLRLKRSRSHAVLRYVGAALGVLLLAGGVALSLALPILTLPTPQGPYAVGSRQLSLIDESRNEAYFGLPDQSRELPLRVWYPGLLAESQARPRVRTLWQDLYQGPMDWVAFLAGYMRGIKTHTYPDIPLAPSDTPYPVLVFSHAYGFFAEQNTLLMEHLASHGYVVIGVNHTRMSIRVISSQGQIIAIDPSRRQQALAEGDALSDEALTEIFASAGSPEELSVKLSTLAPALTEQLAIRVADLRYVMDSIVAPSSANPALSELLGQVDPRRIGVIGMSLGGGTALQACKLDTRCRAGLNLDGPLLGDHQWQALQAPFLSMHSTWTLPFYESVLRNSRGPYYEVLVEGAEHADFSDMTFLLPKWLGPGGEIAPQRAIEVVNAVTLRFFDAHLREGAPSRFDAGEFPELHVRTNVPAGGPVEP